MSEAKVHPPSFQRLQRAEEQGDFVRFKDVNALTVLVIGLPVALYTLREATGLAFEMINNYFLFSIRSSQELYLELRELLWKIPQLLLLTLGPQLILIVWLEASKRRWKWSFNLPAFSGARLNPATNLRNLIGIGEEAESVNLMVKFTKYIAFTFLFGVLATLAGYQAISILIGVNTIDLRTIFKLLETVVLGLSAVVCPALIVISLVDYRLGTLSRKKRLRMTHQEFKRELRDQDGNPELRQEKCPP